MARELDPEVDAWTRDWRRLRHQKHRKQGGVEAGMLLDYLLYEGEHQSVQVQKAVMSRAFRHERDKNKLRLVINLCRRLTDRKIGRHWSIAHRYRATPNVKDPVAFDKADILSDQLIPALDYKLGQSTVRWEIMSWLVKLGVVFEHTDWKEGVTRDILPKYAEDGTTLLWKDSLTGAEVPEHVVESLLAAGRVSAERFKPATEAQVAGEVGADIYDPFRVFVDAAVKQIKFLGPDQAVYLADIRTWGWIKSVFGSDAIRGLSARKDLSIIETEFIDRGMPVSGVNLKDLLPLIHGSRDKDDPEMSIVLTRYQPQSDENPEGLRGFFVPGEKALDKGEMPYPEVPVIDYHWSAPTATMWTTGFVRDLQSLSKFINKRWSQLGEASNAQLYEMLALGGDLTEKDIPNDFPGVIEDAVNPETGALLVQPIPRGNLPSYFMESVKTSMETMEALGSSDLLSQRKFPGQLRGALTLPMIQEIIDSEDGPRWSHLAEQFALEKLMRINRVKQFYPPIRTLNYCGDSNRQEVLEFQTEDLLRAGVDFTVSVDPGSIVPEMSAMREARVRERMQWAPGLYTNPRTGTIDWSKVAGDLKYTDQMREGVENQGRKMARQLIRWARQGKLSIQQGQGQDGKPSTTLVRETGQPFVVLPFFPHNAMMDEYEGEMMTLEFQDASPMYRRTIYALHDAHRKILSEIDQARQNSVNDKMIQGAQAQAVQQSAARAAAVAADAALDQVMASREELDNSGGFAALSQQMREIMGTMQSRGMDQMQRSQPVTGALPPTMQRRQLTS